MSLSLLSFNARGLRNNLKRKAIFLYLKKFKCDFHFFNLNLYGYNSRSENVNLFENIDNKIQKGFSKFPDAYLIIGGDFTFTFMFKDMLLGFHSYDNSKKDQYFLINLLVILAKFHIHKCKFCNTQPLFGIYLNEIKHYKDLLLFSNNMKAVKTLDLLNKFNL